jgi:uncharacterized protein DUF992
MNRLNRLMIIAVGAFVGAILGSVNAGLADDYTTKTGVLTCHAASGFGYIIGSSRTIDCEYRPFGGPPEEYSGTISKIGIDIGYLAPIGMVWAVIAPSSIPSNGALAGNYFGATAQAALLVGGGVNILTGGFEKSVALQPISFEGDAGLYVGLGLASMSLQAEDQQPTFDIGEGNYTE